MVPGSTLMYGSSLTIDTLRPRASRMAPRDAAAMPLPNEDTTPPVTNTKRVKVVSLNCVCAVEPVETGNRVPVMTHLKGPDRRADRVANWRARFQTQQ